MGGIRESILKIGVFYFFYCFSTIISYLDYIQDLISDNLGCKFRIIDAILLVFLILIPLSLANRS